CLMPNHVHLIVVPQSAESLRRAIGEAHRRYTRRINFREGWRERLWQGRFASFVMDEDHLLTAARYAIGRGVRLCYWFVFPPALGDRFKNRAKCLFSRGWKSVGNRFLTK
ncbi:MAG: transposase, partial [Isosphaeraceae bacterium]